MKNYSTSKLTQTMSNNEIFMADFRKTKEFQERKAAYDKAVHERRTAEAKLTPFQRYEAALIKYNEQVKQRALNPPMTCDELVTPRYEWYLPGGVLYVPPEEVKNTST